MINLNFDLNRFYAEALARVNLAVIGNKKGDKK